MTTDTQLPPPPCPWTFAGAPLSCATLDAPTTYRVNYELRPAGIDSFNHVCIEDLGGTYPGKVQSLPMCAEVDEAVVTALGLVGAPIPAAAAPAITYIPWTSSVPAISRADPGGTPVATLIGGGGFGGGASFGGGGTPGGGGGTESGTSASSSGDTRTQEDQGEPVETVTSIGYVADPIPVPLPPSALPLVAVLVILTLLAARRQQRA